MLTKHVAGSPLLHPQVYWDKWVGNVPWALDSTIDTVILCNTAKDRKN